MHRQYGTVSREAIRARCWPADDALMMPLAGAMSPTLQSWMIILASSAHHKEVHDNTIYSNSSCWSFYACELGSASSNRTTVATATAGTLTCIPTAVVIHHVSVDLLWVISLVSFLPRDPRVAPGPPVLEQPL